MVSLLVWALCLQGAAVSEPPSSPEAWRRSLRGGGNGTEISCRSALSVLPCVPASSQPPPFCSWPNGASFRPPSVLLHSEPPEQLFFRIPLKPGSELWRCRPCWVGPLGSPGTGPASGLGWERRTSLGFRLTDEACCLSDRWGDKEKAGSCTGPFWSWDKEQGWDRLSIQWYDTETCLVFSPGWPPPQWWAACGTEPPSAFVSLGARQQDHPPASPAGTAYWRGPASHSCSACSSHRRPPLTQPAHTGTPLVVLFWGHCREKWYIF